MVLLKLRILINVEGIECPQFDYYDNECVIMRQTELNGNNSYI